MATGRLGPAGLVLTAAFASVVTCAAAHATDLPTRVTIDYDPALQEVTIGIPDSLIAPDGPHPPDWLTETAPGLSAQGGPLSRFQGSLAAPDMTSRAGGNDAGAYLMRALDWLQASDDAEVQLALSMPATHRGLVTGNMVAERVDSDRYIAVFDAGQDWPLATVFLGPYVIAERTLAVPDAPLRLRTYFKASEAHLSQAYLDASERYLRRFSQAIGAYPHTGFSVVSAPIAVGYAFDAATYVSEQILEHPYMLGRSLAHEILHGWWGSGVRIDYAAGKWAEALTTYGADYALAEDEGPDVARQMRQDWLLALTQLGPGAAFPLLEFRSAQQGQAIGYGKGAMVFHMLRRDLGDALYTQALRAFWAANAGGLADWSHVQTAFEQVSGRDLDSFFQQWLTRAQEPRITLRRAHPEPHDGAFRVHLTLAQTQPVFDLTVPVQIETTAGPVSVTARLKEAVQSYAFDIDSAPLSVAIDPDFDILRQLLPEEQPVTLQDIRRATQPALVSLGDSVTAFDGAVATFLGGRDPAAIGLQDDMSPYDGVVVVGGTDAVLRAREQAFPDLDLPDGLRPGGTIAWVERDAERRIWAFVAADAPENVARDLQNLRFYGRQGFVTVAQGGQVSHGRLPVSGSPLRVDFAVQ